ncbi:gas vesicle protein [Streptomyces dysideae]|uniref:Gas vesicle synthesis protein n=1 Tax=Streptomyces dysideae TaxID=909626 RepID=A0A124IFC6_9ACTN|nr:gas vesicle protein [Streptomyces dysideae]KUO21005.1 gas vesicle synthesis protein [Streptomyces dysideae]
MSEYGAYGEPDEYRAYGEPDEYRAYGEPDDRPVSGRQVALIDLLDRLLSGGVVLTGDLVLSISDIDLVRISLRAVVISIREQLDEQWETFLPDRAPERALTGRGDYGDEPV